MEPVFSGLLLVDHPAVSLSAHPGGTARPPDFQAAQMIESWSATNPTIDHESKITWFGLFMLWNSWQAEMRKAPRFP